MNIFFLALVPAVAAKYHCDKHVVKMILETVQILYTVHWLKRPEDTEWNKDAPLTQAGTRGYKKTHVKHPSVLWAIECRANYNWLLELGLELHKEFHSRYGKIHSAKEHLDWLKKNNAPFPEDDTSDDITTPKLAMPQECKDYVKDNKLSAVEAYQHYYITKKLDFISYRNLSIPPFLKGHFSDEDNYSRLGLVLPSSIDLYHYSWFDGPISKQAKEEYGIDDVDKETLIKKAIKNRTIPPSLWNSIAKNGVRISNTVQKLLQRESKTKFVTPFDKSRKRKLPPPKGEPASKKQKTE